MDGGQASRIARRMQLIGPRSAICNSAQAIKAKMF